jgi:predicted type IV restriction endonuclease
MSLSEVIKRILADEDRLPPNEQATCDWIIRPLLESVGYRLKEIVPKDVDNNGQFPDYTVLPSTPHTWYLEAKRWDVALKDSHAVQAISYANSNGRRWVVLSNGHSWRLYDNLIQGLADDKLVAAMRLDEIVEAERFLHAIGKASVTSGELERFAVRSRLRSTLREQLRDPNSKIVRDLLRNLKALAGLSSLSVEEVVAYFSDLPTTASVVSRPSPVEAPASPSLLATPPTSSVGHGLDTLVVRAENLITGRRPTAITFPDGHCKPVARWADLAAEMITWLGHRDKLPPLPFSEGPGSKRYFLSVTPEHVNRPMEAGSFRTISLGEQKPYVHTHRSGANLIHCLNKVCGAVGASPSVFVVSLKEE